MIWSSIKNYFINLKHFFTPLGVLALGAVIGLSILINGSIEAIQILATSVIDITGNVEFNFASLADSFASSISTLDWSNPSNAISILFSNDYLSQTLNQCIHSLIPNADTYANAITDAVNISITQIISCFIVFIFFCILGLIFAFIVTRFLVKRTIAKREWWKNIISWLYDIIFTLLISLLFFYLESLWKPSIYISSIALILIYSAGALLKAYLLFGYKKISLTEIVSLKNIGLILLSNILILIISGTFITLSYLLTNEIIATFVSISFAYIGLLVIIYNAEAYVKNSIDEHLQTNKTTN